MSPNRPDAAREPPRKKRKHRHHPDMSSAKNANEPGAPSPDEDDSSKEQAEHYPSALDADMPDPHAPDYEDSISQQTEQPDARPGLRSHGIRRGKTAYEDNSAAATRFERFLELPGELRELIYTFITPTHSELRLKSLRVPGSNLREDLASDTALVATHSVLYNEIYSVMERRAKNPNMTFTVKVINFQNFDEAVGHFLDLALDQVNDAASKKDDTMKPKMIIRFEFGTEKEIVGEYKELQSECVAGISEWLTTVGNAACDVGYEISRIDDAYIMRLVDKCFESILRDSSFAGCMELRKLDECFTAWHTANLKDGDRRGCLADFYRDSRLYKYGNEEDGQVEYDDRNTLAGEEFDPDDGFSEDDDPDNMSDAESMEGDEYTEEELADPDKGVPGIDYLDYRRLGDHSLR